MEILEPYVPTPEEIDKDFRAMDDSVLLINIDCDKTSLPPEQQLEVNREVDRNVRSLQIMLARPYIQDDGRPLDTYEEAIVAGTVYIAEHGGLQLIDIIS